MATFMNSRGKTVKRSETFLLLRPIRVRLIVENV
jgi:hypothetical protein